VLGILAASIGAVDSHSSIGDKGAFRVRAGLVGIVLLLVARLVSGRARVHTGRARGSR
jgi:hypothetical protein